MLNNIISLNLICKLTILATSLTIVGCNNILQRSENKLYNLDLAVKSKKGVNSFIIDTNGNGLVIVKEIYKPDKYYKVFFNDNDISYIQKSLRKIDYSKCDTINIHINDGMQYALYLHNKETEIEVIGGTCKQQKPLDKLVKFIVKKFKQKQKKEVFKGLKLITPPVAPTPRSVQ